MAELGFEFGHSDSNVCALNHRVLLRKKKMKTKKKDGATVMTPRHRKLSNRPLGQLFLGEYTRDN